MHATSRRPPKYCLQLPSQAFFRFLVLSCLADIEPASPYSNRPNGPQLHWTWCILLRRRAPRPHATSCHSYFEVKLRCYHDSPQGLLNHDTQCNTCNLALSQGIRRLRASGPCLPRPADPAGSLLRFLLWGGYSGLLVRLALL
ncbi:hypothetical protein B0H13DRAFT_2060021, partial [Mycena leptocephala]